MREVNRSGRRGRARGGWMGPSGMLSGWMLSGCAEGEAEDRGGLSSADGWRAPEAPDPGDREPNATAAAGRLAECDPASRSPSTRDFVDHQLGDDVRRMLGASCGGSCHAGVDCLDGLIEAGWIVPGSREPLFGRFVDGHGGVVPSPLDEAQLALYLDRREPPPPACEPASFWSFDRAYAAMAADAAALAEADRPFARYVTLTGSSNGGACGRELERERQALFKALNSTSDQPDLARPTAIDPDALIYRVDLRDYGHDRPVDVDFDGLPDHADAWLAIVDEVGAYAVEFSGPDADAMKAALGTRVPVLPAPALVRETMQGTLYTALTAKVDDELALLSRLQVDEAPLLAPTTLRRAAYDRVRSWRHNERVGTYVVDRLPRGDGTLAYFRNLEVRSGEPAGDGPNGVLLDAPLAPYLAPDASHSFRGAAIYHLPNGLFAYAVSAFNRRLVNAEPANCLDLDCPVSIVGASCGGCHQAGLIPVEDVLRAAVERVPEAHAPEVPELVAAAFPSAVEFRALIDAGSAPHRAAQAALGIDPDAPDPIDAVSARFVLGVVSAARAAGELGVSTSELVARLDELDPQLAGLASSEAFVGTDQQSFAASFRGSLCTLHAESRNRPTPCDGVEAER